MMVMGGKDGAVEGVGISQRQKCSGGRKGRGGGGGEGERGELV